MVVCMLVALLVAAPPEYDTVVLANGGILRGWVLEDVPGADLSLETPGGKVRVIPRAEIARVEYARPGPPGLPGPYEAPPPPPEAVPLEAPPEAESAESKAAALQYVPALQAGVALGLAIPVGQLDASGLGLGQAVSPQLTFTFEGSFRPISELELGLYLLLGGGTSYGALNSYCLAVGGWCDALDLAVGFFPRWSFLPRGSINPWVMISGGFEWLSVWNEYHDAFDYTGWQVGAAVGFDMRFGPTVGSTLQLGTRWGQFTSLTVTGLLPAIPFAPATHGWIDLSYKVNLGF